MSQPVVTSSKTSPQRAFAMPGMPLKSFQPPTLGTDLLARAASLLSAEVVRSQPMLSSAGSRANPARVPVLKPVVLPNSSNVVPGALPDGAIGQSLPLAPPPPGDDAASAPLDLISSVLAGANVDELRRRASEFLEALLGSLAQGKAAPQSAYDDRVPLLRSVAPVQAGSTGSVMLRISNEEALPSEVSLYASNFVADSGYELPSLLVAVVPRKVTLPPAGETTFEIKLAVPAQAPPGLYSGLVQATGCKYVKAVVMFEVL